MDGGHLKNVRNVSVVGQLGHGKSTLFDSIKLTAGQVESNKVKSSDNCRDEQQHRQEWGGTTKLTSVPLYYELPSEKMKIVDDCSLDSNALVINLVDSPGHVDFSSEVTAALRCTDGALVVVDCVSGVCVQSETVLRQAIAERIKPVLFMNKMDLALLTLQLDPESLYQNFVRIVENVNVIIATYGEEGGSVGEIQLDPSMGQVGFGSGLMGWGFTLQSFAEMYAAKFDMEPRKLMKLLWGDNFYDSNTKKWSTVKTEANKRGFCMFVLEPIWRMFEILRDEKSQIQYSDLVGKMQIEFGLNLPPLDEETSKCGKNLLNAILQKWLPVGDAMFEMFATHLPSPVTAQRYRMELLYEGPHDDEAAVAIQNCDPNGPLMMYISKLIPAGPAGTDQFYAFGRVFSGRVHPGQSVRIMGPSYKSTATKGQGDGVVQTVVLIFGDDHVEPMENIPCGNICGLVGIDQYLVKTGTVSTMVDANQIRGMKFSVSPILRVAVECTDPGDLPKLIQALKRLEKSDPVVKCHVEESGQHLVTGVGEIHLEVCLKYLQQYFDAQAPLKISKPVVLYRETISAESDQMCSATSANKMNCLSMKAVPLSDDVSEAIEKVRKIVLFKN